MTITESKFGICCACGDRREDSGYYDYCEVSADGFHCKHWEDGPDNTFNKNNCVIDELQLDKE